MGNFRSGVAISVFALAAVSAPASVQAQDQPSAASGIISQSDIIVTAQRRAERQVDVPITITNLSSDQLASAGVNQLSDIARVAPALRFDSQANFFQPTIRGVGTAVVTSGGGANVGIYVDGFYSPNPLAADFQLMKVNSIQVLKGPQGTLFGRNTTGGAILISTAEPSETLGAEFKASYGRFDAQRYQGYLTFGVTPGLAVDLEGMYAKGDGFVRNVTTGSDRDGAYDNWSVRTGLKLDVTDSVSVLLRYTHSEVDDPTSMNTNIYGGPIYDGPLHDPQLVPDLGPGTNAPSSAFTTDPNEVATSGPSEFFSGVDIAQMTIKADLGFGDLTSYTQYRTEDSFTVEDLDHTAANIFLLLLPVKDKTFSQEVLLTSKPGGRLQWTAGLFYLNTDDEWKTLIGTPGPQAPFAGIPLGGSGTTTESYAAFADLTYELMPNLFLTAGARYSHDVVKNAFFIVPFSGVQTPVPELTGDRVTPRVVLRYKPTDQSSVYASFAMGYKAGILDVGGSTGNRVRPEEINAFEVGYKYDDRRLSLDLSAYYYDYKDLQVSLFRQATAQIINAAKSRVYGVEGQVRYKLDEHFEVNAGAAWTHGRYRQFDNAPVYSRCTFGAACQGASFIVLQNVTLRDVTMQRTPEFTGNLGASYTTDMGNSGSIALSGNLHYTSKFFFGPSGIQFPGGDYEVLSLRAEWTDASDRYSVAVFGDNVTNSRYRTQVQYNNFGIGNTWSSPATWGVSLGAKF